MGALHGGLRLVASQVVLVSRIAKTALGVEEETFPCGFALFQSDNILSPVCWFGEVRDDITDVWKSSTRWDIRTGGKGPSL